MADTILSGDFTIYYSSENNQKRIKWTGSASGTRTVRQLYSALQALFDDPSQMEDYVPIKADTPDIYRLINQWFIDDDSVEHLTGGSVYSSGWIDGTTEHVLVIGYTQTTEFNTADIGRTIVGTTTGDEGTLLDFNATRKLAWIRPVDPLAAGDEFDNGNEAYTIRNDAVAKCFQDDAGVYTDLTTECNNATANDVIFPASEEISDALDFGFAQKFSKLRLNVGTAGDATGVVVWEYWNGTAWAALAGVTDGTTGLETAGTNNVTFTVPTNWATTSISGSAQLYYVRVRITTVFGVTNPAITQGWIGGVGAGAFSSHNRHGVASKAGESAWVGITTIGTIEANTHIYIGREDPDLVVADSREALVVATKGTSDWWDDGQINLLLKVKEAANVFGQLPNSSPATAVATVLARQYTKTYSHFVATALATAGGNTVVPLSTADDLDNVTGTQNLIWDNGSSETLVDEELLYLVGTTTAGNLDAGVQDDGGVFTDDTTDLNDVAGGGDVAVFPAGEALNDAFYFGKNNLFTLLMVDISTQGVSTGAATTWEYYNGSTWASLTVVDDSDTGNGAFTDVAGRHLISWAAPSDWARVNVTNQPAAAATTLYYVRVRISAANYTTVPVLETAWCGGEAQLKARVADTSLTTPGGATGNGDHYLLGDPIVAFSDNDVVIAGTSRKKFDINGAPTNVGPAADTDITAAHGQFTRDIDENGVADPYSIDISNAAQKSASKIYERFKFLARRGETAVASTDGQAGQFYLGNELQIEYTGQAGGEFAQGSRVYDQTTDAEGIVVADHVDGAAGDVILRVVRGTFTASNVLSDSPDPSYTMNTNSFCYLVKDAGATIVDESADALSGTAADVAIFTEPDATGDYFAVGATKPFAKVVFNNVGGTAGTVGVVLWEYWDGDTWETLETGFNLVDGTTDFKAAAADGQNLTFTPPVNWRPRGLSNGTINSSTLYFIRARVTSTYTVLPVYDDIQVEDFVTASIASLRTIPAVSTAPFGTFPGASKLFFATGVTVTATQMASGEEQKYSTIDDNGVTRNPPNKQNMTVTNLISGDTVAVFRRTALVINKTQFTLAASNDRGDATIIVDATIPQDNPATDNSKIRIISQSGEEHRYRYTSFTSATFTLKAAVTGTDDGGSLTTLVDSGKDFTTGANQVHVGDLVRQTAGSLLYSKVTAVAAQTLTVTSNGETWNGKAYSVNTLVETYPTGQNAYVPLIEQIASATSHSALLTYSADRDVRVEVRRNSATAILPFSQDTTFPSTGLSIAAIRTPDEITT